MCTLCCREYTWQWIKIWISVALGLFDLIVDIAYYVSLPDPVKQSGPGTAWIVIWVISLLLFIAYIATRVVCIKKVLHRPDDFDHSVPTEKNLRLDTTVLIFDVVFLIVEDFPQFILLLIIQTNGWSTSAIFALLSIFLSVILIIFTGVYILCCCGSRSALIRMRYCVVCCDCFGCGWAAKYDNMRIQLEATKAQGSVAVEKMEAMGISVPQGVRDVIHHINNNDRDPGVTLDSPQAPPPQVVHAKTNPTYPYNQTTPTGPVYVQQYPSQQQYPPQPQSNNY